MRGRNSLRALCLAVVLSAALCLLAAVPALASSTHVFAGSFGEAGHGDGQLALQATSGRAETGGGSGIAVNDTTHDVYVADTGNHRIDQFTTAGTFVRAWGWGVADGTTEALQTCTSGCHAGLAGAGAGQLNEPTFIAVDNSGGPSEGDVYVADHSGETTFVTKFTATGAYLASNDGSDATSPVAGPFGRRIGGVAVDTAGDLWVFAEADPTTNLENASVGGLGVVYEFAQDGSFITDWNSGKGLNPNGMTVNSLTDVYILSAIEYTSSGLEVGEVGGGASGLAADTATNDLYAASESLITHYAPLCEPPGGFFAGTHCTPVDEFGGGGELGQVKGLAVDASNDMVYASDVSRQRVAVFGRTPDVSTGKPQGRNATSAVVRGTVNPDNTAVSDCHFDYVVDAEYNPAEPNPYAAGGTVPCDALPSGGAQVAVQAEITGLTPGAAYHFRLEASNVYGTSLGADETVPGLPPAIDFSSATDVASTSARLLAAVNPRGGETTYRFEYGPTTGYGSAVPVPDGAIGAGIGDVPIGERIQGLSPGTTYHYRVVAHNLVGTTTGPDRTITTQSVGGVGADSCPNAAIRGVQAAGALPDCRAYEQVSPPDKNGGSPILGKLDNEAQWQAAADGSSVAYTSAGVFAGTPTGDSVVFPYLSSRSANGWSTQGLMPSQSPASFLPFPHMVAFSSDLSKGVLFNGGGSTAYGQDDPLLVPGEPLHNPNLFLRDNSNGSYQLIDVTPHGTAPSEAVMREASPDLSHVTFTDGAPLTADAPPRGERPFLYDWSEGTVRLVGILPDGTPIPSSQEARIPTVGKNAADTAVVDNHAVSTDGSRIYFEKRGTPSSSEYALYLRENGTRTVQVDASRGSGPGGEGSFAVASADGSTAYFLDPSEAGLTNDTVAGSGSNLYRYDANDGTLVDVTPVGGAEVLGVVGASEDGSYVYFVANGVLAPGGSPGDCVNDAGSPSLSCNLYLSHNGTTTYIATLNGEDVSDWGRDSAGLNFTAVASPDGRYLAFQSLNSLTGYENFAANGVQCGDETLNGIPTPQPFCSEVFLYDASGAGAEKLRCASCNPSGAAPIGSSVIAAGPPHNSGIGPVDELFDYMPHYLSNSGRMFFNSRDALVSRDVNDQWDVYEYEPEGIGSCQRASGCVSLISPGTGLNASAFRDASVSGDDVFFTTSDPLVAQDGDGSNDLYDARVDGGVPSQNQAPASSCEGEACKAPATGSPPEQAPGSVNSAGQGNLVPTPPAVAHKPAKKKAKRKAKRKVKHKKRRHRRKGTTRSKPRRARSGQVTHDRGGAK